MTNWLKEIAEASTTTATIFAGDALNYLIQYFKNVDHASGDASMIATIFTETRFRSGKLRILDSDSTHTVNFATPNYVENKTANFPSTLLTSDDLLFAATPAIVTGKTIDFTSNTILNIPAVFFSVGGIATFNGNATTAVFSIAHGLSTTPGTFFAIENTTDALGNKVVTADATNITITYATPPPTGSQNVKLVWAAGDPIGGSITQLTGKTVSDRLGFLKVSPPTDPSIEECSIYWKTIDANNNGLFIKGKKGGVIVEGQIF